MWIIDFESSGLSRESYPIEVGLTNGIVEYQAYIRPLEHWCFWSEQAEQIHGIPRAKLLNEVEPSSVVATQLNNLLSGEGVYCDSIQWDGFWNNVLFSDNGIHCNFQIRDIVEYIDSSNINTEDFLGRRDSLIKSGKYVVHSALDDARILQRAATFSCKDV